MKHCSCCCRVENDLQNGGKQPFIRYLYLKCIHVGSDNPSNHDFVYVCVSSVCVRVSLTSCVSSTLGKLEEKLQNQ